MGGRQPAERRERDLLALVAHDVRSPLAVIVGYANTLRDRWSELSDAEKRDGVATIARSGARLARMVDDGLHAALDASGESAWRIAPFDLGAQIREVVADFSAMVDRVFSLRIDDKLPLVLGDERYNAHVLENLLSNAVNFSAPATPVRVEAEQQGDMAVTTVRDLGVGISAAEIPKLFGRFAHVGDAPENHCAPSAGLGLHFARRIVEAQGGCFHVESRPGLGSSFSYTLPISRT